MPKKLDQVAALSWDDKELTGMRASRQLFLDLQSQSVHASPHIRLSDRQFGRQLYPVVCERIPYVIRTISLRGRTEAAGHLAVR